MPFASDVTYFSPLILISAAATCNAIMDVCSHHYYQSIFNDHTKENERWYYEANSWKNKYVDGDPKKGRVKWSVFGFEFDKPVVFTDAWHFYKMLMIIFICLAVSLHKSEGILGDLIYFGLSGIVWNVTFSFFYEKVLIKKIYRR